MYVDAGKQEQRSQAQRRAATRRALIDAGHDVFAARGYAEASTEEIVRRAGATRGALYHHFADKRDLFRAVVEAIEQAISERVRRAALAAPDPAAAMLAGAAAFLDACLEADVRRVLLIDGPAALGEEAWRAIDARFALAEIEAGLQAMVDANLLAAQPVRPLAHLIHGALIEAGLVIAAADDPAAARAELGASFARLLGLPPATDQEDGS